MTQAVAYFGVYCWCIVIGGLKLRTEAGQCVIAYLKFRNALGDPMGSPG